MATGVERSSGRLRDIDDERKPQDAAYESMTDSTTDMVNASQGRFQLSLGGTNPYAYVRIVVCLRTF